jgi:hypothetical protein
MVSKSDPTSQSLGVFVKDIFFVLVGGGC